MGTRHEDDDDPAWRTRAQDAERELQSLRRAVADLVVREQRERHRLSRELHGNLQQLIILAKMRLGRLLLTPQEELKSATDAVDEVLSKAVAESRAFSNLLSPPLIHDAGLVPALRWMVRSEAESGGVEIEAELAEDVAIVDLDRRVAVFAQIRALVAQARGVGAKHAALTAQRTRSNGVRLTLRVRPGFSPEQTGVAIAELLGSTVELKVSGDETTVVLTVSSA